MTYPILNMAQFLCAPQSDDEIVRGFVRSSRLPRLADGPHVIAIIENGLNQPVARWVRNPNTRKLECRWFANNAANGGNEKT